MGCSYLSILPCPCFPVCAVLSALACLFCPFLPLRNFLPVLFFKLSRGLSVLTLLFRLSFCFLFPDNSYSAVLLALSCLSCPSCSARCPVLPFLSTLFCPGSVILSQQSVPAQDIRITCFNSSMLYETAVPSCIPWPLLNPFCPLLFLNNFIILYCYLNSKFLPMRFYSGSS